MTALARAGWYLPFRMRSNCSFSPTLASFLPSSHATLADDDLQHLNMAVGEAVPAGKNQAPQVQKVSDIISTFRPCRVSLQSIQ